MNNPRKLFLPKLREMPEQCVSCPFREDNDEEFGRVVAKLAFRGTGEVLEGKQLHIRTATARSMIRTEAKGMGDFHCHCSVYDDNMNVKPIHERKQCPGATKHYVEAGEKR